MLGALGAAAAIVGAAILLVGVAALAKGRASLRPWLLVLFGINAGRGEFSMETLRGVPGVDVALLVLAAATYGAFWPGPGSNHALWTVLAVAQPLLGIPLLVLSLLMVVDGVWTGAGLLGVGANVLLLVGDFGTTGRASRLLAAVVAAGYAGLVVWFVWVAVLLLA